MAALQLNRLHAVHRRDQQSPRGGRAAVYAGPVAESEKASLIEAQLKESALPAQAVEYFVELLRTQVVWLRTIAESGAKSPGIISGRQRRHCQRANEHQRQSCAPATRGDDCADGAAGAHQI